MGDIPLFRELQKILASSEGPINLEIARQVANALNQDSSDAIDPAIAGQLPDLVRESEFVVAGYTRLAVVEPARSETLSRRRWIAAATGSWRWLLTHLAARFGSEVARFGSERGDEADPMGAVLGQVAPLLLGMQTGTLIGHLARDVLGRYDPNIPHEDDGHLYFVIENLGSVASEYDIDEMALLRRIALEDVTRHTLVGSVGWLERYRRSLFLGLVDSIEIDTSDLEGRLMELQTRGPEALQEGVGPSELLPVVESERHTRAVSTLRAFNAVFDGYARHSSAAIAADDAENARIEEAMKRRAASPSEGRSMLQAMLGLTFDGSLEQAGATFCAAVVELHGIPALNKVWEAPDNLPTLDEVRDPFQWIERVLDQ